METHSNATFVGGKLDWLEASRYIQWDRTSNNMFHFHICSFQQLHLKKHIRLEKKRQCKICDRTCPSLDELDDHVRTHMNGMDFKCHICEYRCNQKYSLKVCPVSTFIATATRTFSYRWRFFFGCNRFIYVSIRVEAELNVMCVVRNSLIKNSWAIIWGYIPKRCRTCVNFVGKNFVLLLTSKWVDCPVWNLDEL